MQNYTENDYALNVNSKGIVYDFADGIRELTFEDFLAENPAMSEEDFKFWKGESDGVYLEQDRQENAQNYKNISYELFAEFCENDELNGEILHPAESAEDTLIGDIDVLEEEALRRERIGKADDALGCLTEVQRKRYLLHHYHGMTTREIAESAGVSHVAVVYSLELADKKIKNFLKNV